MSTHYFCLHGHFYQPPRGNPFLDDEPGFEVGAAPFRNISEKALATCYKPNADLGNFEVMSFNVGSALSRWMQKQAPETYARIVAADHKNVELWGVGNAMAQPTHHAILPLCLASDMALLVRWGLMTFEYRFGRPAEGMWLPELGVDLTTLQVLHNEGVKFTVLSQAQVVRGANQGAGPYWVRLPSGGRIAVFVRDDELSSQLAFSIANLGGAGRWARNTLVPYKRTTGPLVLAAAEGETFGYHFPGEEHFVRWLLQYEAAAAGYEVTTLNRYFRDHPPTEDVVIKSGTSWAEPRNLDQWQGALRRAFDNLATQIDKHYINLAQKYAPDPEQLLTEFIRVRLGQYSETQFLDAMKLGHLTASAAQAVLTLLWAQFYRQRMYTSASFYYEDLERLEARHAIADAVHAAILVRRATGLDLLPKLRDDLTLSLSQKSGRTGAQYLDDSLELARASGAL